MQQSVAAGRIQGILFYLSDLVVYELSERVVVLGVDAVLGDEAGGNGGWVGVDVGCGLLLGAANIHTYLEGLVRPIVVGALAEATGRSLARRDRAQALPALVERRLREHFLLRTSPVGLWPLERRVH